MNRPTSRRFSGVITPRKSSGHLRQLALLILGLSAVASRLFAMSVEPPSFEQLVDTAARITRVEVLETKTAEDRTSDRPLIHTFVRCRVLRSLKGEGGDELTLRFLGGKVGRRSLKVVDMPALAAGERYVVFLTGDASAFCPLTAAGYGAFPVATDAASGCERITRLDGSPLRQTAALISPLGTQRAASPQALAATISLDDFETAILAAVARHSQTR